MGIWDVWKIPWGALPVSLCEEQEAGRDLWNSFPRKEGMNSLFYFAFPDGILAQPIHSLAFTLPILSPPHQWGREGGLAAPLGLNHKVLVQPSLSWEFYVIQIS